MNPKQPEPPDITELRVEQAPRNQRESTKDSQRQIHEESFDCFSEALEKEEGREEAQKAPEENHEEAEVIREEGYATKGFKNVVKKIIKCIYALDSHLKQVRGSSDPRTALKEAQKVIPRLSEALEEALNFQEVEYTPCLKKSIENAEKLSVNLNNSIHFAERDIHDDPVPEESLKTVLAVGNQLTSVLSVPELRAARKQVLEAVKTSRNVVREKAVVVEAACDSALTRRHNLRTANFDNPVLAEVQGLREAFDVLLRSIDDLESALSDLLGYEKNLSLSFTLEDPQENEIRRIFEEARDWTKNLQRITQAVVQDLLNVARVQEAASTGNLEELETLAKTL